ncbi:MAG: flavin reductase family protein [Actinomycetota bacterium]|jgi:hypothetical protein
MTSLEISHFTEAVGHFATGVVVVTAMGEDGPQGFTCQTFSSLSLEPLLVSFAARSQSSSWPRIRDIGDLAINILASDQESLARGFATSASDKFAGISWRNGSNGAPLLEGTLASIEGTILDLASYGDHDIAIVAPQKFEVRPGVPLLYFRGGFGQFVS